MNKRNSTFIVFLNENEGRDKARRIDEDQENMLWDFGFRYANDEDWPNALESGIFVKSTRKTFPDDSRLFMILYDDESRREEIENALVSSKIPFMELTNDNLELYFYDGKSSHYDVYPNVANLFMLLFYKHDFKKYDYMRRKTLKLTLKKVSINKKEKTK